MRIKRIVRPVAALLLAGSALAATTQLYAQETLAVERPVDSRTTNQTSVIGNGVLVTGRRMPTAEAPRSSTCEVLVRDSHYRALRNAVASFGGLPPNPLVPTRLPRNPDWSAPPLVPPGSPLPELGEGRFGMPEVANDDPALSVGATEVFVGADPTSVIASSQDIAAADCRELYEPGAMRSNDPADAGDFPSIRNVYSGPSVTQGQRRVLVRYDERLPMAFALFDQGRYAESLEWFRRAERHLPDRDGGEEAMLFIGKITLQGLGNDSNPQEAIKWLKKAATARYDPTKDMPLFDPLMPERNTAVGEAAIILANVYRTGFAGIAQDFDAARKWYERAYDVGHIPAAYTLGDLYYNGAGGRRDVSKALKWYREAAKFDLASAQFAVGQILEFGDEGVEPDVEEALRWYEAAARQQHSGAQFALAIAYDRGEGVPADPEMAMGFYKEAALQGHAGAMAAMGTYFYEGDAVARDHDVARNWFAEAAERGDPDGMFNLAVMQIKGEGGQRDRVEAWTWLARAAQSDHAAAPQALALVEAQMSPEERNRLQDAAASH